MRREFGSGIKIKRISPKLIKVGRFKPFPRRSFQEEEEGRISHDQLGLDTFNWS